MEFYDLVDQRRSIRSFTDQPVSDESLKRIAKAVQDAPTACNRQPFKILAIRNPEKRAAIRAVCNQDFIGRSPVILVALGNEAEVWRRPVTDEPVLGIDLGIAFEHAVLAAANEGLGCCWVCWYEVEKMNRVLGVEAPWSVVALAPLGYPGAMPPKNKRKNLDEIFEIVD